MAQRQGLRQAKIHALGHGPSLFTKRVYAGLLQKFSDRILQGSSFHTSHMILNNIM